MDGLHVALTRASVVAINQDVVIFSRPEHPAVQARVGHSVAQALSRLSEEFQSISFLAADLSPAEEARFHGFLFTCEQGIRRSLMGGRECLLDWVMLAWQPQLSSMIVTTQTRVRLSRFALLRNSAGALVLESSLVKVRIVPQHPVVLAIIGQLAEPKSQDELRHVSAIRNHISETQLSAVVEFLVRLGILDPELPSGHFAEDSNMTLKQWEFHDLLFHSRIRLGRFDGHLGGSFPHRGEIPQQPAIKPLPAGESFKLPRPKIAEILDRDPQLTVALEGRRSLREYGIEPLTLEELAEFLYRVARVRVRWQSADPEEMEMVGRPYPAGGSAYELELYLNVRRCRGLSPGSYYVDPVNHQLIQLESKPAELKAMFEVAARSTGSTENADILVTITSRFQRLSWKYQGIAYATTLRHTGVLYQTMYLVATAMGLAPCALGVGDAELSARALCLEYLQESSVGEFLLGSRSAEKPPSWAEAGGWQRYNNPDWAEMAELRLESLHRSNHLQPPINSAGDSSTRPPAHY